MSGKYSINSGKKEIRPKFIYIQIHTLTKLCEINSGVIWVAEGCITKFGEKQEKATKTRKESKSATKANAHGIVA